MWYNGENMDTTEKEHAVYSIDAVEKMLSQIGEEIPGELFRHLNGGVVLLEACKAHPQSAGDLYIMGEYSHRHDMGRCIYIYYGSFMRVYGYAPEDVLRKQLRGTLLHELTHHLESLAGERGLEVKDRIKLEEYRRARRKEE